MRYARELMHKFANGGSRDDLYFLEKERAPDVSTRETDDRRGKLGVIHGSAIFTGH